MSCRFIFARSSSFVKWKRCRIKRFLNPFGSDRHSDVAFIAGEAKLT
jgi:hypothetical protein